MPRRPRRGDAEIVDNGLVLGGVGFVPSQPAEFVVTRMQQHAGSGDDHRCDALASFRFRISCDGRHVAGISTVSALGLIARLMVRRDPDGGI